MRRNYSIILKASLSLHGSSYKRKGVITRRSPSVHCLKVSYLCSTRRDPFETKGLSVTWINERRGKEKGESFVCTMDCQVLGRTLRLRYSVSCFPFLPLFLYRCPTPRVTTIPLSGPHGGESQE